jgi:hypothetical protein
MTIAQNVLQQPQNWSSGTVGTGFIYNGHVNSNPATGLSASGNDANSNYGEETYNNSSVGANNKRTLVLSNGEVIWDLAGSLGLDHWDYSWKCQPGLMSDAGYVWRDGILVDCFKTVFLQSLCILNGFWFISQHRQLV